MTAMRDLNECTAEVFRRSGERIKEMKRVRQRVLAVCVPLCFCVAVISVLALSQPATKADTSKDAVSNGSCVCSFVKAEIKGEDGSRTVSDRLEVWNIYFALHDMFEDDGEAETIPLAEENGAVSDDAVYYDRPIVVESASDYCYATYGYHEYDITFYTADGDKAVYTLCGRDLTDRASGTKLTLTDEQAEALIEIINAEN